MITAPQNSKPVKTEMNLTTATTSRESAFLHRNGDILDHRMHQAKDMTCHQAARNDDKEDILAAPLATSESMDETDFVNSKVVTNKSSQAFLTPLPNIKAGIVYSSDGSDTIESGNLDELIHEFVPRAHFVPSEDYQFTFLLASR